MAGTLLEIGNERRRLFFDSIRSESWEIETQISEHSTVDAKTVTDNAEKLNPSLQITARVVASPLNVSPFSDLPESGDERLNSAVELVRDLLATKRVQWRSPRFGYTKTGLIGDLSFDLVQESHVEFSFQFTEFDFATQREVELPPERVPKPTNKPTQDQGKKKTKDEQAEVDDAPDTQSLLSQSREASNQKVDALAGSNTSF